MDMLKFEAKARGSCLGLFDQCIARGLRQEDKAAVIAEIRVPELGVRIELQWPNNESIEVLGEEVGQVERTRLRIGQCRESFAPREKLVAMRTRKPLDTLFGNDLVDATSGATVRVGDEDLVVLLPVTANLPAQTVRDVFGTIV